MVLSFTGHYCISPKLLRKGLRSFELLLFDCALKQIKRRSPKKLLGKRNSNGKDILYKDRLIAALFLLALVGPKRKSVRAHVHY